MARKKRAKDLREEQKRMKQEQYKVAEEKRQKDRVLLEKQKEREVYEKEIKKLEKDDENMRKLTKSKAKAAGLKSVFDLGKGKLLMTSFGNGSKALSDKYIQDKQISDASMEAILRVSVGREDEFYVSGRMVQEAVADNPLHSKKKTGQDLIHCREKLEKLYYGRTFEDNIHIQLIYNILDIEKILAVLGTLRQATAHGEEYQRIGIFKFDNEKSKGCRKEARKELNSLYSKKVHELNEHFLEHSAKDIHILSHVFGIKKEQKEQIEKLVKDYYEFIVLKSYKNLGFSIKRLRETIITHHASDIGDDTYSTVRARLYRTIDFIIFKYYQEENTLRMDEIVDALRACMKESEKEYIYRQEAKVVWNHLQNKIEQQVLPQMNGKTIAQIKDKYDSDILQRIFINEKADPFSEIIYLLTIFLDGKEINDMLTQLINRFDNIQSFIDVMKREQIDTPFLDDYKIFERSYEISKELRVINSFARMSDTDTKTYKEVYKVMFLDAADVLGYKEDSEKLEKYIDETFNTDKKAKGSKDTKFRNFINNNVIKSSRFKYLVRYGNPKKIRALAANEKVIDFVLKDIPDDQIQAYYNSCYGMNKVFFPEMRNSLKDIIMNLNFNDFIHVRQDVKDNTTKLEEQEALADKNKKRNIIRVYLTVLYLVQKNLIYVNSRYFLAFHCVERDAIIYDAEKYNKKNECGTTLLKKDYASFARDFIREYPRKKRVMEYLETNFNNTDKWSLNEFRNCCAHLGAIRNMDKYIGDIRSFRSYFELYHYLVQRHIIEQFKHDCSTESKKIIGTMVYSKEQAEGKLLYYFELVEKYHSYCKDFVKALCVPFAYNLPRYKNLAINELYDRNNYLPNKGKEMNTKEIWK